MQRADLLRLSERLTELAEALGGKAPTAKGQIVWLDALGECAIDDVLAVLTDWPKSHAKMPLPVDVLKLCRERVSERVERRAEANARDNRRDWMPDAIPARTEVGRAELARIKAVLRTPKQHVKAWARRILEGHRPNAGEYATELARRVLFDPDSEQESPDDREARLEREAIAGECSA